MKKLILILVAVFITITAWCQTPTYKVYALNFAAPASRFPIALMVDKGPTTDSVQLNFMVWLIKGTNGKNILVDAGFLREIPQAKEFGLAKYTRPDSTLLKLGLKAGDITDVILTHPHWDHIDGLDLFPNAHVWIQKEDYNYFAGAAWQKDGEHGGFTIRDVNMLVGLNTAGKVTLVDGDDKEIIPGIKVYTGARHTFNSQYVLVETGTNKVILASDNIWIYYSLEHLMPASKGGTFDPAGQVKAMQRMKTLVSDVRFIIPGHDSKIFSNFQKVADGVVEIR